MKKLISLLLVLVIFASVSFAKEKTFTKEATEVVPASQSQDQVIAYLTQKLTREATEEAGTFITSELNIKNYAITKDEFSSFAGSISKVKVEKKESFMKDKQQYVKVKLKITVDTDNIKTYLDKIAQDKEYEKEAEKLRKEKLELEEKLKTATKKQYEQELSVQVQKQMELQKQRELELDKMSLQAQEEIAKAKEEQIKKAQEREQEVLKLKEQIAKEKDNIKKAELENLTKIKELENKANEKSKVLDMNFNYISISQAVKQANQLRKEEIEILKNFESLIKENRENLIKSYDEQIKISIDSSPKGQWEPEYKYKQRLEENEKIKERINTEKANSLFEYNKKIMETMNKTLESFPDKEQEILGKYYYDESGEKATLESMGEVDVDNFYFAINIKYKEKSYTLNYQFLGAGSDIDGIETLTLEQAKLMYETPQLFVIEPLYKIDSTKIAPALACFNVKHLGTGTETKFNIRNENAEFFDFFTDPESESVGIPYAVYLNLLLIDKLSKLPMIEPQTIKELKMIDILLKSDYYKQFNNVLGANNVITHIAVSNYHTVGLKANGTAVACGSNQSKQCNTSPIHFYVCDIAANGFNTVGLNVEGSISYCGWNGIQSIINPNIWTGIKSFKLGYAHAVGLKEDGTVLACGDNSKGQCNVKEWKNIIAIAVGENHTIGLKKDGTVVACGDNSKGQCNVKLWKDIKFITAKVNNTAAIKKDGTVVACGDNSNGQCNTSNWQNIADVAIGYVNIAGIKKDGTVVVCGDNSQGQYNTKNWKDVIKIDSGNYNIVGLKKDGTVVATGWNGLGQCDVKGWKDIVEIAVAHSHTVGLDKHGKVFATGWNEYGQCNVEKLNK